MENEVMPAPALAAQAVTLRVRRLARSITFYKHVFGFRLVADARHEPEHCVIMTGPGHARLTLREENPLSEVSSADAARQRPQLMRLPVDDLDAARASLWDLGVPLARGTREPGETGRAKRSLFVDDPDGNRIELAERRWEPGAGEPGAS
jgi:catechol 2,3-dioxygenase-like lactoylglutathione lyase family enzyme